ncbi:MAG: hypothetical protein HQK64_09650 [Desulfamplus sp.]|nr:hypothetical protein [Desulfamplus sp.]
MSFNNIEKLPNLALSVNNFPNNFYSKEYITVLKNSENGELGAILSKQQDNKTIIFILENLGHLPKNFDGSFLKPLLNHEYSKIRLLAA